MTPVLAVEGLRKAFGGLVVTRDVSFTLAPGARHAFIGPNGAGKSTVVNLLSGVLRPDAGTICVDGTDVTAASVAQRVRLGLVRSFQISNLFNGLSVLENVFLAVSERERRSFRLWRPASGARATIASCDAVLDGLGLHPYRHRRVDELAYGQQRLVEIAIAIGLKPKVLLLDEPAAGIPSGETGRILDAIERLPSDLAILLIEHDMGIVRRFADSVTVLVEGQVLITGDPASVMRADEVRAVYLGASGQRRFHQAEARRA